MLRSLRAGLLTMLTVWATQAVPAAQPDPPGELPCPVDIPFDGADHALLIHPEAWGPRGVLVTAGPENPGPVTLVFVSPDGVIWKGGQIPVFPGSSVVIGSLEDVAILVRTLEIPGGRGTLCAQPAYLPDEFHDIAVPGGCGGNLEHKSVRAQGWISVTATVPNDQPCPVEITLEAENPDTGARTFIGRMRVITGGTGVIESYSPPPGYLGPTPFLRIRVECSFEPESTCRVTISGGFVPESEPHLLASVSVNAACGGSVVDVRTPVPAVFDLMVENPSVPGSPSCPFEVNIVYEGLPAGVPQPFPDPVSLAAGEDATIRLDNTIYPGTTLTISIVCFFSPDGTCRPGVDLARGGLFALDADVFDRQCGEAAPQKLMMFYTKSPVKVDLSVDADSCPVTLLAANGAGEPKKVATIQPGGAVQDREIKPVKARAPTKKDYYEVLTLYTRCEKSPADSCVFSVDID